MGNRVGQWQGVACFAFLLACLVLSCLPAQADCQLAAPRPAPSVEQGEWLLATANFWNFFDEQGYARPKRLSSSDVDVRLDALARWVRKHLSSPHVLALQEVENLALLERLVSRIEQQGGPQYKAVLLEGHDPSGLDVAVLYRAPFEVASQKQLYARVPFDQGHLFSRPPLYLAFDKPFRFRLLNVHLRSGRGLGSRKKPEKAEYVRRKRIAQVLALQDWMAGQSEFTVLLGDMNTFPGERLFNESGNLLYQQEMNSAWSLLPEAERFSYVYRCQPQPLDHILWQGAKPDWQLRAGTSRGNAGYYRDLYGSGGLKPVSDHDALLLYLNTGDGRAR